MSSPLGSNMVLPAAVAREIALGALDSYRGGSTTSRRSKDYRPTRRDADSDYLPVQGTLIARGRDLVRNVPVAAGAVNLQVTSVVGSGLRLQARIDSRVLGMTPEQAQAWEAHTEAEWRMWSESHECDVARTLPFPDLQELAFRAVLESGDCVVLLPYLERAGSPYGLKLQVLEADRLSNPGNRADTDRLVAGVERDQYGAPVRYWIQDQHPGGVRYYRANARTWSQYEAFGARTGRKNVLHLFKRLRPGQSRGVPILAPVVELIMQLGTYTQAEVDAAVNAAFFTVFVTSTTGEGLDLQAPTSDTGASASDEDYRMGAATMIDLDPDEDIRTPTPGRPNTAFHPFVQALFEQIGMALEIPYELLTKHFSASFSASQAAILEAWRFFRARRAWLVRSLCRPVYETWLDEAVARARVDAPGYLDGDPLVRQAWLGSMWIGPPQSHIREDISVKAARERIAGGLSTHAREALELTGQDFDTDVLPRLLIENAQLGQAAQRKEPPEGEEAEEAEEEPVDTAQDEQGDEGS